MDAKLLILIPAFATAAAAQIAAPVVGWYNGDWKSGIPGQPNWFFGGNGYSRVYDDFVVPAGGWTVVGVFSLNRMEPVRITEAAWEIRKDMAPGKGGKRVAYGYDRATQTPIPGQGPFPGDPAVGYRIQVDGLHVVLAPGRYWLSVAPRGRGGHWYINATTGQNAIGDPPGNNGKAYVYKTDLKIRFRLAAEIGKAQDFSQGVFIEPKK